MLSLKKQIKRKEKEKEKKKVMNNKEEKNLNKQTTAKQQKEQQHIIALAYITVGDAIRQSLYIIGPKSFAPLSP